MREVAIAGYLRTAQSRSRPGDPGRDWLHKLRGEELLAILLPALLNRAGVPAAEVDDFIVGSAMGIGEQWTYGGRLPLFLANFPKEIPAKFVDQQCGSAMAAVHMAYLEIATGNADVVLAGGMEHMTRIPMDALDEDINPRLFSAPEYTHWHMETTMNMGLTAEKLFQLSDLTRDDMDRWGLRSHELALKARKEGFFEGEIYPIEAEQADGSQMKIGFDQSVRAGSTLEKMTQLRPVFKQNGVITAGNSSPLNAGAASMLLVSREKALEMGLEPMASIRSIGFAGVDPTIMGSGPVPASEKALKMAELDIEDIDYWEINEAFSVVTLYSIDRLGIDPKRVNVKGGAIAIGHPLGATGIRLIGTLARILEAEDGRYGVATACVGGGQGVATVIERNR
jgi:acetyl-CoA acyltransferase